MSRARWPDPIDIDKMPPLVRDIVEAIEPNTESDVAALIFQLLPAAGCAIGRRPYYPIEADRHRAVLNVLLVGASSRARKGTGFGHSRRLVGLADPSWQDRIRTGIQSGEVLVHEVRDEQKRMKQQTVQQEGRRRRERIPVEEVVDAGVTDKRLQILAPEFSLILGVMRRNGSTLSAMMRDAWDCPSKLFVTAKHAGQVASNPHISVIGHTTREELLRRLDETEIVNGFLNRFLLVCTRRSKLLPDGGNVPDDVVYSLAARLHGAIEYTAKVDIVERDAGARELWCAAYPSLVEERPGIFGAATSRMEAQALRLSLVLALLDSSNVIRPEHVVGALELTRYATESAAAVLGDRLGDPVADKIDIELRERPDGMSRTMIRDLFARNSDVRKIEHGLELLEMHGRAERQRRETGGRTAEWWVSPKGGA